LIAVNHILIAARNITLKKIALGSLLLLYTSCVHAQWLQAEWDVMGTRATLELWLEPRDTDGKDGAPKTPNENDHALNEKEDALKHPAVLAVRNEFERLNQLLSPWIADSELALVNANAARTTVAISPEFQRLLQRSRWYFNKTQGAFDITFASAGHLYDYREGVQPDNATLESVATAIGLDRVKVNDDGVTFSDAATRIDLGGIAKGYAIDQAIALLKTFSIEHAYIGLGGDSYVLGDRNGRPWQVGIRHPRDEKAVALKIPVSDIAISTSGDYERYFLRDGERVHHIINPSTGRSSSSLVSATVLAEKGIDADALSTSVFVMGPEQGLAMINTLDGVSAILITPQGDVLYSDDLISAD
jgi:FAD:protein FMN transferase